MHFHITTKSKIPETKPYSQFFSIEYYSYLMQYQHLLASGQLGVYLSRKVVLVNQELYSPLIDIDGHPTLKEEAKLADAINNARLLAQLLRSWDALDWFTFIATGGEGFRAVAPVLLSMEHYRAFCDLIAVEMPFIHDTKPTCELEMPHQVLTYKGSPLHNRKELHDRHARVIPTEWLLDGFRPVDYVYYTSGRPCSEEWLSFLYSYLDFHQITDLRSLGGLGEKIDQHARRSRSTDPRDMQFVEFHARSKPAASLETIQTLLQDKGVNAILKEQERGMPLLALDGQECICCGKTSANPYILNNHRYKCHNSNCSANKGLTLREWSPLLLGDVTFEEQPELPERRQEAPPQIMEIEQAREFLSKEFRSGEDVYINATAGVGKSYEAVMACLDLAADGHVVLYSCPTNKLKDELENLAQVLNRGGVVIRSFQTQESCCLNKTEYRKVVSAGYSPAQVLCGRCEFSDICTYRQQFADISPGVYFSTHRMTQHILNKDKIRADFVFIDESFVDLFSDKITVSTDEMLSLHAVGNTQLSEIINAVIQVATTSAGCPEKRHSYALPLGSFIDNDFDSILGQLEKSGLEHEHVFKVISNFLTEYQYNSSSLYELGVSGKAVEWLKGFLDRQRQTYLFFTPPGKVRLCQKRILQLDTPATLKIFDATAHEFLVHNLVQREVKYSRIEVPFEVHSLHIKTSIQKPWLQRDLKVPAKRENLKRRLEEALKRIKASSVLVISHKQSIKRIVGLCKELAPDKEFKEYYFFGPRGVNSFKNIEAVLVLGAPWENLTNDVLDAQLFFPCEDQQDLRDTWHIDVMEREITQLVHRIRPIHKSEPSEVVVIASQYPSCLPGPDEFIDMSRSDDPVTEAFERVKPFIDFFGFYNNEVGYLFNIHRDEQKGQCVKYREVMTSGMEYIDELFQALSNDILGVNIFDWAQSAGWNKSRLNEILKCLNIENECEHQECLNLSEDERERLFSLNISERVGIDINRYIMTIPTGLKLIENCEYVNLTFQTLSMLKRSIKYFHMLKILFIKNEMLSEHQHPIRFCTSKMLTQFFEKIKNEYPHFLEFKINVPFSKNNKIKCVGEINQCVEFYNQLDSSNLTNWTFKELAVSNVKNPDGTELQNSAESKDLAVFMTDVELEYMHGNTYAKKSLNEGMLNENFSDVENIIFTHSNVKFNIQNFNNADILTSHDLTLRQVLLFGSSNVKYSNFNIRKLFKHWDMDVSAQGAKRLYQMLKCKSLQNSAVERENLTFIDKLESQLIPITLQMQEKGFWIDVERLNKCLLLCQEGGIRDVPKQLHTIRAKINSDGVYPAAIKQMSTTSGRFSFERLHNLSAWARPIFGARPGRLLVMCDVHAFEPSIAIGWAQDSFGLEILDSGENVYLETHRRLAPHDDVWELGEDFAKEQSKNLFISLMYQDWRSPGPEASDVSESNFRASYYEAFQGIRAWREETIRNSRETGQARTKFGRLLNFTNDTRDSQIVNFCIQGTGADILKQLLLAFHHEHAIPGAEIIFHHHDSIFWEVDEQDAQIVGARIKETMERLLFAMIGAPASVKMEIRRYWGEGDFSNGIPSCPIFTAQTESFLPVPLLAHA